MNFLKTIDVKTFINLKSLNELNLNYNLITHIDAQMFANTDLKELALDYNQISNIDVNSINKLKLKSFSIENNDVNKRLHIKQVGNGIVVSYLSGDKSIEYTTEKPLGSDASNMNFKFLNLCLFSSLIQILGLF